MEKKTFTFLILNDRDGVTRRLVLSSSWLKAITVSVVVIGILFSAAFIDYMGLLIQSVENKKLKVENIHLKNQFSLVEGKVQNVEKELEKVRDFVTKLRAITDTEDPNRTLSLSMDSTTREVASVEGMEVDDESRKPNAIIEKENSMFFNEAPLDKAVGELASRGQKDYSTLSIRIDRTVKQAKLQRKSIIDLWGQVSQKRSLLRATPSILPTNGWMTSGFGYRPSPYTSHPTFHQGLDIAANPGTAVRASADGIISFSGYNATYGKLVSVDHGYGVVTRYGHNSKLYVKPGQFVKRGDLIAAVGSTGRSTGHHLHYEVRVNGVPVDPKNYILGSAVQD